MKDGRDVLIVISFYDFYEAPNFFIRSQLKLVTANGNSRGLVLALV